MTKIIFTAVDGVGLVFMLYVLVQFWREGRRSQKSSGRKSEIALVRTDGFESIIVTRVAGGNNPAGLSLIPREARRSGVLKRPDSPARILEIPLTRREGDSAGALRSRKMRGA